MEEEVQYDFSEINVEHSTSVSHSKRATPEELVKMANGIWKTVLAANIPLENTKALDELLEQIQTDNYDFNLSFPIVLRWMVQMRKYRAKAFEKYLMKHSATPLDSKEKYLELQAEYLVLLYREEHPHCDESYIREYKSSLVKHLLEEDKAFMEMHKKIDEEFEAKAEMFDADRRRKLYEYLMAQKIKNECAAAQ